MGTIIGRLINVGDGYFARYRLLLAPCSAPLHGVIGFISTHLGWARSFWVKQGWQSLSRFVVDNRFGPRSLPAAPTSLDPFPSQVRGTAHRSQGTSALADEP